MSHFASGGGLWNRALLRPKSPKLAPVIASDAVGDANGIMDAPSREKVTQKDALAGWERPPQSPGVPTEGGVSFRSRGPDQDLPVWTRTGLHRLLFWTQTQSDGAGARVRCYGLSAALLHSDEEQ